MGKRIWSVFLTAALLMTITSCGGTRTVEKAKAEPAESGSAETEPIGREPAEAAPKETASSETKQEKPVMEEGEKMKIRVAAGDVEVVFALNETSAAASLYEQLPLTVDVENYGGNEKIFYPEKLDCADIIEGDCPVGTLAYFSPWGNVVMYYGPASRYPGLYLLGEAVDGAENIGKLSGQIEVTVEKAE